MLLPQQVILSCMKKTLLHMYSMNQAPCCHLDQKNKMRMSADKSRSSGTEVGKLQKRRRDRGINKGKYFHVGSINNNNNNQSSSSRSVFSNLLRPDHSKASEVKTASTPLLGNEVTVYFSSQHHYYIKQQLWEQFPFLQLKTLQESSP